jgi:hypothetical protein
MKCTKCGKEVPQGLAFCSDCGTPVAGAVARPAYESGNAAGTRDQVRSGNLVYPRNPPLSPHLALLSLIMPGVPQIAFGQTVKGIVMLAVFIVGVPTGCIALGVLVASIVDAYMVGNALQAGKPVGQWQFFPQ